MASRARSWSQFFLWVRIHHSADGSVLACRDVEGVLQCDEGKPCVKCLFIMGVGGAGSKNRSWMGMFSTREDMIFTRLKIGCEITPILWVRRQRQDVCLADRKCEFDFGLVPLLEET